MKPFHKIVIKNLDRVNIKYIIGADSLVGFSEGDIFKYSPNLHLYLFPFSKIKLVKLFLILIFNKIIIKPKKSNGKLFYRLRFKPTFFKKNSDSIRLSILKSIDENFTMHLGGADVKLKKTDLAIETKILDNLDLKIPHNLSSFVNKYRADLMLSFYKKHSVSFDSESEKKAVKLLLDVNDILKNSNVDYWIEGGTLLGAIRDKKLIPWDHDLDLGMKYSSDLKMKKMIII